MRDLVVARAPDPHIFRVFLELVCVILAEGCRATFGYRTH